MEAWAMVLAFGHSSLMVAPGSHSNFIKCWNPYGWAPPLSAPWPSQIILPRRRISKFCPATRSYSTTVDRSPKRYLPGIHKHGVPYGDRHGHLVHYHTQTLSRTARTFLNSEQWLSDAHRVSSCAAFVLRFSVASDGRTYTHALLYSIHIIP